VLSVAKFTSIKVRRQLSVSNRGYCTWKGAINLKFCHRQLQLSTNKPDAMNKLQVILVISAVLGLSSAAIGEKRPKHTIDFDHYWSLEEVSSVRVKRIRLTLENSLLD
jgi:hypothetical protein